MRSQLHAIFSGISNILAGIGIYLIYLNKENEGKMHLKTTHSLLGAAVFLSTIALGLIGGVFLHPDFGLQKTNKLIRKSHKLFARATLGVAWMTAFAGLYEIASGKYWLLALYAVPLVVFVPYVLM
jgi:Eukaryotic cytochrome b561